MTMLSKTMLPLICSSAILIAGCATKPSMSFSDLESAPYLKQNTLKNADQTPYTYNSPVNWRSYSALIVDPVSVYNRADHQFEDVKDDDKQELAQYMKTEFSQTLRERFKLTNSSGPGTLRLKLTLMGASKNTTVVSTFTRFDLVGLPVNAVQGIRGKEGIFMGSVTYSTEIFDAQSNRLLKAYITKQFPNAMNIVATFGALSAAKTGIDKGAEALLADLR